MGRPARNSGGTGGHGYVPLPGDRPNLNHHVLSDQQLLSLLNVSYKKAHSRIDKKFPNEVETSRNDQGYDQFGQKMLKNKEKVLQVASVVKSSAAKPAVVPQGSPSKAEAPSMDVADLSVKIAVPTVKMPMSSTRSELTSKPLVIVSRPSVMMNDSTSKESESCKQDPVTSKAYSTETKVPSVKASVDKLVPSDVMKSLAVQLPTDTNYVPSKVISQSSYDPSSKQVSGFTNDMSFAISKLPKLKPTEVSMPCSDMQMPTSAFPATSVEKPVSSCEKHASSDQSLFSLSGSPCENPENNNKTLLSSNYHTSSFFMYGGMLYNAAYLGSKPFWPSVPTTCDFNQTYNHYIHHQTSLKEMDNHAYNQPSNWSTSFLPTYHAKLDDGKDAESDERLTRKDALDE
jgi:hypothetical protein